MVARPGLSPRWGALTWATDLVTNSTCGLGAGELIFYIIGKFVRVGRFLVLRMASHLERLAQKEAVNSPLVIDKWRSGKLSPCTGTSASNAWIGAWT